MSKIFTLSPQPSTERGRPIQLSVDPKGKTMVYCNSRTIIMRDISNPGLSSEYTQHSCHATVARYSPSGYYIASGDVQGNIRIWDTINSEHILKTETKIFSGKINDLAWDFESKRLIGVGEGKDRFGHAFTFDTATTVGEIGGHSKAINSVSMRPGRPLRAVTGSDDFSVNIFHGAPFKFAKSHKDHTRFVQCVRYNHTGSHFLSASSDSRILMYEGKEGDKVGEFVNNGITAHKGSVFSLAWAPDGNSFLSASADMTCKVWDVNTMTLISTVSFSSNPTFENQQVGCLWTGNFCISASLSGDLNYIDPRVNGPVKVVKGHQRGITALASVDEKTFVTASYDGRVLGWDLGAVQDGGSVFKGTGHSNQVVSLGLSEDNKDTIFSCAMDDSLCAMSFKEKKFMDGEVLSTGSTPRDMSVSKDGKTKAIVNGSNQVLVYKGPSSELITFSGLKFVPSAVALFKDEPIIAIGGEDGKVHIFDLNTKLETGLLEGNRGIITSIAYSPDSRYVCVGDSMHGIYVYDSKTHIMMIDKWVFHSSRINSLSWSKDSKYVVSSSLDTNIQIWSIQEPSKHIEIKNAHLDSATCAVWLDNQTVVSVGADAFARVYKVSF